MAVHRIPSLGGRDLVLAGGPAAALFDVEIAAGRDALYVGIVIGELDLALGANVETGPPAARALESRSLFGVTHGFLRGQQLVIEALHLGVEL